MKPRRYRLLKSPAPENSARWRCSWLNCAHGMGLAGMGRCAARGEWWNPDCRDHETEGELLARWAEDRADALQDR